MKRHILFLIPIIILSCKTNDLKSMESATPSITSSKYVTLPPDPYKPYQIQPSPTLPYTPAPQVPPIFYTPIPVPSTLESLVPEVQNYILDSIKSLKSNISSEYKNKGYEQFIESNGCNNNSYNIESMLRKYYHIQYNYQDTETEKKATYFYDKYIKQYDNCSDYCEPVEDALNKAKLDFNYINFMQVDKVTSDIYLYHVFERDSNEISAHLKKRNFIYKISPDSKLGILNLNNNIPSCNMYSFFTDDKGGFSYGTWDNKIYTISNNKVEEYITGVSPFNLSASIFNSGFYSIDYFYELVCLQHTGCNSYEITEDTDVLGNKYSINIKKVIYPTEGFYSFGFRPKSSFRFASTGNQIIYKKNVDSFSIDKNTFFFKDIGTSNSQIKLITDMKGNERKDLFVADLPSNKIWKVENQSTLDNLKWEVQSLAGTGYAGYKDGKTNEAMFNQPRLIDLDGKGNVYVLDKGNFAIRKISTDGMVSTVYKQDSDSVKVTQ